MARSHEKRHRAGKGSFAQGATPRAKPPAERKRRPAHRKLAPAAENRKQAAQDQSPLSSPSKWDEKPARARAHEKRHRTGKGSFAQGATPRAKQPAGRKRRTVHRKLAPATENRKEVDQDQPPPAAPAEIALLEQRLGHSFTDSRLLRQALTHSSASADNYERLEFLGDATLGFVIGRLLFKDMPEATEQRLTLMRVHVVSAAALVEVARTLELGRFLVLGSGERRSGGAERPSILADGLEAVLGAVLCDGGLNAVTKCIRHLFASRLAAAQGADLKDPKTRLQEHLQRTGLALPRYEIAAAGGLDHAPVYAVECVVETLGVRAKGVAGSRREAEKHAAAQALKELEKATSFGARAPRRPVRVKVT